MCVTGVVLTIAWLGLVSASGVDAGIPLTVVVHDDAGVSSNTLDRARQLVSSVFNDVGVHIAWMNPAEFVRSLPSEADQKRAFVTSIVQIRFMSPSMTRAMGLPDKSLGIAVASARFAWIAFDKIRDSAGLVNLDPGDALGYVMAHELGHLLLPPNSHSAAGLMREELNPGLIAHNRVRFLDTDAVRIRASLEEHFNSPVTWSR